MLLRHNNNRNSGFTLIELMVVVIVLGVLAAVAIPAFIKYIRRAKTAEAEDKISLIHRGGVSYFINTTQHVDRGSNAAGIAPQFPAPDGPTPAAKCCLNPDGRCVVPTTIWESETWVALDFGMNDPFVFQYTFESSGAGVGALFTARANGDLDCDDTFSTFERTALATSNKGVRSSRGIYRHLPIE